MKLWDDMTSEERAERLMRYRANLDRLDAEPRIDRVGQVWDIVSGGQCVGVVLASYPGFRRPDEITYYHTFRVLHSDECPNNVGKTWSIDEKELAHPKSWRIL